VIKRKPAIQKPRRSIVPGSRALPGGKAIGVPPPGGVVKPPPKPPPAPVFITLTIDAGGVIKVLGIWKTQKALRLS
jgi:hypothetical protein